MEGKYFKHYQFSLFLPINFFAAWVLCSVYCLMNQLLGEREGRVKLVRVVGGRGSKISVQMEGKYFKHYQFSLFLPINFFAAWVLCSVYCLMNQLTKTIQIFCSCALLHGWSPTYEIYSFHNLFSCIKITNHPSNAAHM
jgi:hypothetical protein